MSMKAAWWGGQHAVGWVGTMQGVGRGWQTHTFMAKPSVVILNFGVLTKTRFPTPLHHAPPPPPAPTLLVTKSMRVPPAGSARTAHTASFKSPGCYAMRPNMAPELKAKRYGDLQRTCIRAHGCSQPHHRLRIREVYDSIPGKIHENRT